MRQQVAALAKKLEAEGLMDASRKRRIPTFCTRVAVVTSPTGSVIDDVKRTLARRNPLVELLVSPCAVQGEGAPAQIITALVRAAAVWPDAILLVRGGGSFEDLMTFNDEALARAVAACPVPVITGIGHEPDTCICDMVADRRCSTPTAAAESVAPAFDEILRSFHDRERRLANSMRAIVGGRRQIVEAYAVRAGQAEQAYLATRSLSIEALAGHQCLRDPYAALEQRASQLEITAERMHEAVPRVLARLDAQVEGLAAHRCLQDPLAPLKGQRATMEQMALRLHDAAPRVVARCASQSASTQERLLAYAGRLLVPYEVTAKRGAAQLEALSPLKVLARGYAIMRDEDGHVVSDVDALSAGDEVSVLVDNGMVHATVLDAVRQEKLAGVVGLR